MKRILLILPLLLIGIMAFAQTDINRTTPIGNAPANTSTYNKRTVNDANLRAYLTLYVPKGVTPTLNNAKDSVGAVFFKINPAADSSFYVYHGNNNWVRYAKYADIFKVVKDSLANYQKLTDGIVTGLVPTATTNSLSITAGTYRLNNVVRTASARTFSSIPLSASGLQRILVIFGNTSGGLDTLSGAQSTNPVTPILPANTTRLGFTTVTSTVLNPPSQDLSGYVTINTTQDITGSKKFEYYLKVGEGSNLDPLLFPTIPINNGEFLLGWNRSAGIGETDFFNKYNNYGGFRFYSGNDGSGNSKLLIDISGLSGVTDFKQNPTINGVPIGTGNGTVTSITAGLGLTGGTITTSGTIGADTVSTTGLRTKANSLSLAQTQTALNLKANDNSVVHLAGAETISGVKTFTTSPVMPSLLLNNSVSTATIDFLTTNVIGTSSRFMTQGNGSSVNDVLLGYWDGSSRPIGFNWGSNGSLNIITNSLRRIELTNAGNLSLFTAPTTSASTYDLLSRNSSTGEVEKVSTASLPISTATQTALNLKENLSNKDALNGYVGLTGFKLNINNGNGLLPSTIQSIATSIRNYSFQDKSYTIADSAIVASKAPLTGGTGYIQNGTSQQASSNFNISGNGTVGGTLAITGKSTLTGNVGIGTAAINGNNLRIVTNLTGSNTSTVVQLSSTILSDVGMEGRGFVSQLGTQATSFSLNGITHFSAIQNAIGAGSTVSQQFGFRAGVSLIGATNNYGFYGDIPSGTNNWNLYMNGTAKNYLNGTTLIGTTTDNGVDKLQVSGTASVSGLALSTSPTTVTGTQYVAVRDSTSGIIKQIKTSSITGGGGTVTSFSKTDNFGILSSVTNPTTTPNHAIAVDSTLIKSKAGFLIDYNLLSGRINGKEPLVTAGTTAQYYRGDKSFQTLNTSVVPELTNLYYTDARARNSLSFVAGSGAYNSTTGIITIPTNNNQITNGAGYLTSSSGVSSITGTSNQVNATSSTGAVTLSLPQSIATTSTPIFGGLGLGVSPTEILQLQSSQPVIKFTKTGVLNWKSGVITGNDYSIVVDNFAGVPINISSGSGAITLGTALTGTSATFSGKLNLSIPTSTNVPLNMPYGVAPTTPTTGDIWSLSTGVRTQTYDGTNTKDVLFDKTNSVLAGLGNVSLLANNAGTIGTVPTLAYLASGTLIKSTAYTITSTDFGSNGFVNVFVSGNTTITLPTASVMSGVQIRVIKTDGAGTTVTLSTGGTITIQNHSIIVVSDGTNRIELL